MSRIFAVLVGSLVAVALAPAAAPALELPEGFATAEEVAGLDGPTALAYAPDGRLFVAEKAGRVRVVGADGRLRPDPLIDVSDHVNSFWDRGLLGLAVDADFATNHRLYLLYTHEANGIDPSGPKTSRLTRVTVTDDNHVEQPEAPETVLVGSVAQAPCPAPANGVDCIPSDSSSHSIGTVRADPDGTLWLGSGDGAGWGAVDPTALRAYDERSLGGKLMHVDRDGKGLPGHPFCPGESDLTKVCTKLYAKGFRNPFRFHLRPSGGPVVGDVAWESFEELNLTEPGRSYGWPCYQGAYVDAEHDGRTPGYRDLAACSDEYDAGPAAHHPPAYSYPADGSTAIVAGPRYDGDEYPGAYRGAWFFGDFAQGFIRTVRFEEGQTPVAEEFATGFHGGVALERAPNGDLVYVLFGDGPGGGSVQRIVYGNRPPVVRSSATPSHGVAPLAVTLSAAGSTDPEGEALTYEWDLDGDGSPDATGPSVGHTYPAGAHKATLTVRDARGLAASASVVVLADESPPTATLLAPAAGTRFRYGRPIQLAGAGADAQDGPLGDASLHWRISIHHAEHVHVVEADRTGREISFTPPGEHDADSHLEFRLTARDSAGLQASKVLTMHPETVGLRLESSPPGALLSYAGIDVRAPALRTAATGFRTTVSAPQELVSGGLTYRFDGWSDGGARLHDIVIPDGDVTLTAGYRPQADPTPPLSAPPLFAAPAVPSPASAPSIRLDAPAARGSVRRLRGRVLGSTGRLRVDVALRLRRDGRECRWWRRSRGRLSAAGSRCDRPRWMRAGVDASGRWRLDLRGRPGPGTYAVLMRGRTVSGRLRIAARTVVLRLAGSRSRASGPGPRAAA